MHRKNISYQLPQKPPFKKYHPIYSLIMTGTVYCYCSKGMYETKYWWCWSIYKPDESIILPLFMTISLKLYLKEDELWLHYSETVGDVIRHRNFAPKSSSRHSSRHSSQRRQRKLHEDISWACQQNTAMNSHTSTVTSRPKKNEANRCCDDGWRHT